MKVKIEPLPTFQREAKQLYKKYRSLPEDLDKLRKQLQANPSLGASLGQNVRKIRMRIASKGRGKSGGARVITFTVIATVDEAEVNLLFIYDKSERGNISEEEIEALLVANGLK